MAVERNSIVTIPVFFIKDFNDFILLSAYMLSILSVYGNLAITMAAELLSTRFMSDVSTSPSPLASLA